MRFNRLRLKLGTFHMLRPDADSHEARSQPRQERQRLEDSRGKQTPSLPDAGLRSRRPRYGGRESNFLV